MFKLSPATRYLLEGFIPYTEANIKLAYKPHAFFNELERKSGQKERTLRSAYYRAVKKGFVVIDVDGIPRLTEKGRLRINRYKPKRLGKDAFLLVSFDIPEEERKKRDHFRALLHELEFTKIQQSVWYSQNDHRELLSAEITEHNLQYYVKVYEATRVKL
jgi:phenylacetic acid degradation operon negative regulatory protein